MMPFIFSSEQLQREKWGQTTFSESITWSVPIFSQNKCLMWEEDWASQDGVATVR